MGLFSDDIQRTSISLYIERLSNLEEIDWYLLQQLTESIQMQENGPRESVETIRKKLKHGSTQQKLRVLEVLKLLMENSNQQFHRQFAANEKMIERFEIILTSPVEDTSVKKELISLLGAWSSKYKNEPSMRVIVNLYSRARGGGIPRTRPRANTDTSSSNGSATAARHNEISHHTYDRSNSDEVDSAETGKRRSLPPPSMAVAREPVSVSNSHNRSPLSPTKSKHHSSNRHSTPASASSTSTRGVFNFEKAKSKILEEIAVANSNANNLTNALKLINTAEDRWEIELQHDKKLQEYHDKCEESRKKIVRYTRLVENEEWIGTLLNTNEELLKALEMYDIMLAGQTPSSWNTSTPTSPTSATKQIAYHEPPKALRAPPPPPLESSLARMRIQSPSSYADSRRPAEEEEDPFADPVTPIEDDDYPDNNNRTRDYLS